MWVQAGSVEEVTKKKKVVVATESGRRILVIAHNDRFHAMDNVCIHREREMHTGVILKNKLVCPGHQWAFDLETGWESVKEQGQPVYTTRVVDGMVEVDDESAAVASTHA
ncbi:MAG: Rieske (2Fe-2S) protein [Ilumatobacteraceae bacterium]